jgi:hypothetical protein
MPNPHATLSESAALALAMMMAADAELDPRELERLDALDAYQRLGVSRGRFLEIAQWLREEMGEALVGRSWLSPRDVGRIDPILDAVADPQQRLLVCRLAAGLVTATGHVSTADRLVWDYMLGRWHISPTMVSTAIRQDRLH